VSANNTIAFPTDENGMILTLTGMNPGGVDEVKYPPNFHTGFAQPDADAVNAIHKRLRDDGYDVPEPGQQHGSWTFDFTVPGGFTIEVLA
jgi:catechol-2,3-dioxygenase